MFKKYHFYLIFSTWIVWLFLVIHLLSFDFDLNQVYEKNGIIREASCINGRSKDGIKVLIEYDSNIEKDFLSLDINTICDKVLLSKIEGGNIKITVYKNYYIGIYVDDMVLRSTENGMGKARNKFPLIGFITFIAIVFTLAFILKSKGGLMKSK